MPTTKPCVIPTHDSGVTEKESIQKTDQSDPERSEENKVGVKKSQR